MSLPHILLGMLRKKPKSGYDLNKEIKEVVNHFWETDQSRIYRTLRDLRNDGLVAYEMIVQEGTPNKKLYYITDKGLEMLKRWLAEPNKRMSETRRNPFLAQLHFSDMLSLHEQEAIMATRLEGLLDEAEALERRAQAIGMPVPLPEDMLQTPRAREMFSLEYGIRRLHFEIAWTENILKILSAGQLKT